MGSIATEIIGSDTVSLYSSGGDPNGEADSFWNVRRSPESTAWAAATEDDQNRALLMAADWIDRASRFTGTKTASTQPRAWPRDNATCDGEALADGSVPDDIANAQFYLAGVILVDNESAAAGGQGSNVKEAKAGSASVKFFTPTVGSASDVRLPLPAHDLIQCYLSAGTITAPKGTGDTVSSSFDPLDFTRSEGYS